MLIRCPDYDEIKHVFSLIPASVPGPDGFGGSFYHACSNIMGLDVCNAVKEFFFKTGFFQNPQDSWSRFN